jgi:hypothetical protein
MRKERTLKILRNGSLYILYIILLFSILVNVGQVTHITTYNVSGVNSLQTSLLLDKYTPKPVVKPKQKKVVFNPSQKYRLTSFYPAESTDCTGSGLCSWNFKLNKYGWYTYKGKLVLATATPYLQKQFGYKEGKTYFKYYDELNIKIDDVVYPAIVLDTCGACYGDERLDLFVQDGLHGIDRGYMGRNMVSIEITKKQ